ncbi:hypothetical protein SODALDRAFT_327136 [Sodiomyces alkalinus F11]|uniref:Uncharacterized protein n=1 Tax=Sodiomyces alkalinus (strain CBS 110278 / VKM F-3762 / F11) TaxID=1314773 RepID=A0A3N2Q8M0_SODAK|nr:hypothetical protein SODALDRAFT_327136 [Sodiomyces alkalinus F11]ROT42975.1 hypothetical protein SODALDRAFT_327136 [Sodiomyces alkalinus F11]
MTRSSHYQMPGAYWDSQTTGVHPGIFRPPISSSSAASSMHLVQSAASLVSENASSAMQAKRKRDRKESSREHTPLQEWSDANMNMNIDSLGSHTPHLDTPGAGRRERAISGRYTLAGQLETPGGGGGGGGLEDSLYSDSDYRRALGSKRPFAEAESPANGHPHLLVKPDHQAGSNEGWSKLAFNTIGGVVGKFWEFCKTGAFKGFYAGGGKGYALNDHNTINSNGQQAVPTWDSRTANGANMQAVQNTDGYFPSFNPSSVTDHTVPGGFPQSDYAPYSPECFENTTPESTPSQPAAKRRQLDEGDELRRNWIVVDEPTSTRKKNNPRPISRMSARTTPSRNSRPSINTGRRISVPVSRLSSSAAAAAAASPRRTAHANHNRISHAGSPGLSPREPASFASFSGARLSFSRPSSPGPLSPSRIPVPSRPAGSGNGSGNSNGNGRSSLGPNPFARPSSSADSYHPRNGSSDAAAAGAPHFTHRRTQSGASAATSRAPPKPREEGILQDSPRLTPEAKKLAAKRRREEQNADMRMNDFNTRLQEMIRQGKEALGTKIEVAGDAGGWESEDD